MLSEVGNVTLTVNDTRTPSSSGTDHAKIDAASTETNGIVARESEGSIHHRDRNWNLEAEGSGGGAQSTASTTDHVEEGAIKLLGGHWPPEIKITEDEKAQQSQVLFKGTSDVPKKLYVAKIFDPANYDEGG